MKYVLISILMSLLALTLANHEVKQVNITNTQEFLDKTIQHWLEEIPRLIEIARIKYEFDTIETHAKRVTQGWSIVVGSW